MISIQTRNDHADLIIKQFINVMVASRYHSFRYFVGIKIFKS